MPIKYGVVIKGSRNFDKNIETKAFRSTSSPHFSFSKTEIVLKIPFIVSGTTLSLSFILVINSSVNEITFEMVSVVDDDVNMSCYMNKIRMIWY